MNDIVTFSFPDKYPERGLSFQNLPYKCRRRAASHHRNRIPSRLRKNHQDIEPAGKRPAKKYKKRKGPEDRAKLRTEKNVKWMTTHKWHAKRFHMTTIDDNWKVPNKANEKNYRAVWRAVSKKVYLEDLSYWQCLEMSGDTNCKIKTIVSGEKCENLKSALDINKTFCWILDDNHKAVALSLCLKVCDEKSFWWTHPSNFQKVLEIFQKLSCDVNHRQDLCLFHMMGPETLKVLPNLQNLEQSQNATFKASEVLQSFDEEESKIDEEMFAFKSSKTSDLTTLGLNFYLAVPKSFAFKLWLQSTHRKCLIGCLDSQDHLDVELQRFVSPKLCQDIG